MRVCSRHDKRVRVINVYIPNGKQLVRKSLSSSLIG